MSCHYFILEIITLYSLVILVVLTLFTCCLKNVILPIQGLFNLPLMSRTKETGWAIGSSIGEVMEVDVPDSGVIWGKSLRVRVRIDATKRLIRGKKITIEGGAARWVQFKY